jgi:mRNA-degrading endonuclease toxin of MazEF toxin-antitoxin module
MTVGRGEIWLADLNPTRGSEQAGVRPVLIFQNEMVSRFTATVLTIPLTTNIRRVLLFQHARKSQKAKAALRATPWRSVISCGSWIRRACGES